eukprot:7375646-Prymnesium_polylepis.1
MAPCPRLTEHLGDLPHWQAASPSPPLLCAKPQSAPCPACVGCLFVAYGLWMVRHKAVLERYAALRCLWHG